eukprot:2645425-Pleurochrysis_carterae.AAC.1
MDTKKRSTIEETTWVRSGGINSASDRNQRHSSKNAGRGEKASGCEQVKPSECERATETKIKRNKAMARKSKSGSKKRRERGQERAAV